MPFQPGNTEGSKSRKAKPYRDALMLEAKALENGDVVQHPKGSLRAIAQARLLGACSESGSADAKEIADRLDGKVPQAVVGDDEHGPIEHVIRWKLSTSSTMPPEDSSNPSTSEPNASPA